MYHVNIETINAIVYSFKVPKTEMCRLLGGIPKTTFAYWMSDDCFPIDALITICNAYKVSIWDFVEVGDNPKVIMELKKIQNHKPISIDWSGMGVYLNSILGLTISQICAKIKMGRPRWYKIFDVKDESLRGSVGLREYLEWCDIFGINADMFLRDDNKKLPHVEGYKVFTKEEFEQIDKARPQNSELLYNMQMKMSAMEARLAELERLIASKTQAHYSSMVAEDDDTASAMLAREEEMNS